MRVLTVKGVRIDDTFAEAFGMRATGVTITADTPRWARQAAVTMTGFATSVIGCGCEAGIDCELVREANARTGGPGVRVLLFAISTDRIAKAAQTASAQCVLTTPGSACYAEIEGEEALRLGNALRYFGDGWQISKRFGAKHFWRIPVMDGEFVCEATTGFDQEGGRRRQPYHYGRALRRRPCAAAEAAAAAIGRACRMRSRLFPEGSRARAPRSAPSTRCCRRRPMTPFCPTLRGAVKTALDADFARCSRSSSTG